MAGIHLLPQLYGLYTSIASALWPVYIYCLSSMAGIHLLPQLFAVLSTLYDGDVKRAEASSIMGGGGGPNVLCGRVQLLNGPTLTGQRLPMACVKLFLAVFVVATGSTPLKTSTCQMTSKIISI